MSFAVTPFGLSGAPTVPPRYRPVGDDWLFELSFVEADGVTPYDLTSAAVTVDLYLAFQQEVLARLTVGSGVVVQDASLGAVTLVVAGTLTQQAPPQDPNTAVVFGTRLIVGLTEGGLHRSVAPIYVCPFSPRTVQPWPADDESPVVITVQPLPTIPVVLSGAIHAPAVLSATISAPAPVDLAGGIPASATLSGAPSVGAAPVGLSGAIPASASLSGAPTIGVPGVPLTGTIPGAATLAGAISVGVPGASLGGAIPASAALTGGVSIGTSGVIADFSNPDNSALIAALAA